MIRPTCARCGTELTEFGAIAFSPPTHHGGSDHVEKFHLCADRCWPGFLAWMDHWTSRGFIQQAGFWVYDPGDYTPGVIAKPDSDGWCCEVWAASGAAPIESYHCASEIEARTWCYAKVDAISQENHDRPESSP